LFPDLRQKRVGSAIVQALRDNFPSLLSQTLNKAPFPLYANAMLRGERIQQAVAITPIDVAGAGRHCLIQINDVSNAVGREKLLRDQTLVLRTETFLDGLTGVANRRHFDMAMEKELRRAKRIGSALSLLMIDIDHFKSYNDHYGHQQGDACLIKVAGALASTLQRPGDLLARYGGEEFAAILPETGADHAWQLAEAIRARVEELNISHTHASSVQQVTVCIGIASQDIHAPLESGDLIGAADRALYLAKHAGRNRVMAHSLGQSGPKAS
jgi:diguanylate cyclase (GGDEF)-like protein